MIITIEELSEYLKISKETIYKMLQKKDSSIPSFKIGNQWRFQKSKIDSWLEDLSNLKESEGEHEVSTMEDDNGIC